MHDGQMLIDSATIWNKQEWGVDEMLGKLMSEKKIKDCIVVGIWNKTETRHRGYFPQKPFELRTKAFQDSLIYEAKRDNKGALISMYAICEYPSVFFQ